MSNFFHFFRLFYNETVFQLYAGGLFSLLLAIAIVFVKQIQKRSIEKKRLEQEALDRPVEVGDIDQKLDDSFEYKVPDIMEQLVIWGIQPLAIICFINLFTVHGDIDIVVAFIFIIYIFFHEFYLGENFAKKRAYQWFIIGLWLVTFLLISVRTNQKETDDKALQLEKKCVPTKVQDITTVEH